MAAAAQGVVTPYDLLADAYLKKNARFTSDSVALQRQEQWVAARSAAYDELFRARPVAGGFKFRNPRVRGLVRPFEDLHPALADDAFVAEGAVVVGDVVLGAQASVWYGTVLRGDTMPIRVGARSNVQDNSVVHITTNVAGTVMTTSVTSELKNSSASVRSSESSMAEICEMGRVWCPSLMRTSSCGPATSDEHLSAVT